MNEILLVEAFLRNEINKKLVDTKGITYEKFKESTLNKLSQGSEIKKKVEDEFKIADGLGGGGLKAIDLLSNKLLYVYFFLHRELGDLKFIEGDVRGMYQPVYSSLDNLAPRRSENNKKEWESGKLGEAYRDNSSEPVDTIFNRFYKKSKAVQLELDKLAKEESSKGNANFVGVPVKTGKRMSQDALNDKANKVYSGHMATMKNEIELLDKLVAALDSNNKEVIIETGKKLETLYNNNMGVNDLMTRIFGRMGKGIISRTDVEYVTRNNEKNKLNNLKEFLNTNNKEKVREICNGLARRYRSEIRRKSSFGKSKEEIRLLEKFAEGKDDEIDKKRLFAFIKSQLEEVKNIVDKRKESFELASGIAGEGNSDSSVGLGKMIDWGVEDYSKSVEAINKIISELNTTSTTPIKLLTVNDLKSIKIIPRDGYKKYESLVKLYERSPVKYLKSIKLVYADVMTKVKKLKERYLLAKENVKENPYKKYISDQMKMRYGKESNNLPEYRKSQEWNKKFKEKKELLSNEIDFLTKEINDLVGKSKPEDANKKIEKLDKLKDELKEIEKSEAKDFKGYQLKMSKMNQLMDKFGDEAGSIQSMINGRVMFDEKESIEDLSQETLFNRVKDCNDMILRYKSLYKRTNNVIYKEKVSETIAQRNKYIQVLRNTETSPEILSKLNKEKAKFANPANLWHDFKLRNVKDLTNKPSTVEINSGLYSKGTEFEKKRRYYVDKNGNKKFIILDDDISLLKDGDDINRPVFNKKEPGTGNAENDYNKSVAKYNLFLKNKSKLLEEKKQIRIRANDALDKFEKSGINITNVKNMINGAKTKAGEIVSTSGGKIEEVTQGIVDTILSSTFSIYEKDGEKYLSALSDPNTKQLIANGFKKAKENSNLVNKDDKGKLLYHVNEFNNYSYASDKGKENFIKNRTEALKARGERYDEKLMKHLGKEEEYSKNISIVKNRIPVFIEGFKNKGIDVSTINIDKIEPTDKFVLVMDKNSKKHLLLKKAMNDEYKEKTLSHQRIVADTANDKVQVIDNRGRTTEIPENKMGKYSIISAKNFNVGDRIADNFGKVFKIVAEKNGGLVVPKLNKEINIGDVLYSEKDNFIEVANYDKNEEEYELSNGQFYSLDDLNNSIKNGKLSCLFTVKELIGKNMKIIEKKFNRDSQEVKSVFRNKIKALEKSDKIPTESDKARKRLSHGITAGSGEDYNIKLIKGDKPKSELKTIMQSLKNKWENK